MKYIEIISSCVYCIIALYFESERNALPGHRTAESIIVIIYQLCDLARSTFVVLQWRFASSHLVEIARTFTEVSECFERRLQHRITYTILRREYCHTFTICISVLIAYAVGYFGRVAFGGQSAPLAVFFVKLVHSTVFTYLHVLLYVHALSFHMAQLNFVVRRDTELFAAITTTDSKLVVNLKLRYQLGTYKYIHYRLWTVSGMISQYFGYSMITLFLHTFYNVMYCSFWCYQIAKKSQPWHTVWSEFC